MSDVKMTAASVLREINSDDSFQPRKRVLRMHPPCGGTRNTGMEPTKCPGWKHICVVSTFGCFCLTALSLSLAIDVTFIGKRPFFVKKSGMSCLKVVHCSCAKEETDSRSPSKMKNAQLSANTTNCKVEVQDLG